MNKNKIAMLKWHNDLKAHTTLSFIALCINFFDWSLGIQAFRGAESRVWEEEWEARPPLRRWSEIEKQSIMKVVRQSHKMHTPNCFILFSVNCTFHTTSECIFSQCRPLALSSFLALVNFQQIFSCFFFSAKFDSCFLTCCKVAI